MSHTNHVNMDDDDSYTGSGVSTAATDPLDGFLARYTASFNPEYCLTLRKKCEQVKLSRKLILYNHSSFGALLAHSVAIDSVW